LFPASWKGIAAKMFSAYPDEWPGAGLLLLRAAIGAVLIVRGVSFLIAWHDLPVNSKAIALFTVAGAVLLLTGYLTRFGAVLVALASASGIIFWSSTPTAGFLQSRLTAALIGTVAIALACLGPGAFSFDARLFGRQEIVFPETKAEK
jgi:uncharacterized membrane protein YphA (DoxX/SURF4 family)